MEVIEHLYEAQVRACGDFHLLMKRAAHLFLTTPNYGGLWPLVELVADRSGRVAPMTAPNTSANIIAPSCAVSFRPRVSSLSRMGHVQHVRSVFGPNPSETSGSDVPV